METIERIKIMIDKGFTYNRNTGEIFGVKGGIVINKAKGYIRCSFKYKGKKYDVQGHQFAFFYIHKYLPKCIDHINRIKCDNRIDNLRESNTYLNAINNDAKGYRKVRNKYQAEIRVEGKYLYLGYFDTEEKAHDCYLAAKKIYHKWN